MLHSDNYNCLHGFQVIRIGIFAEANEAENLQTKLWVGGQELRFETNLPKIT